MKFFIFVGFQASQVWWWHMVKSGCMVPRIWEIFKVFVFEIWCTWLSRGAWFQGFGKLSKFWLLRFDGWNALFISPNGSSKNLVARNFSLWLVFKLAKFGGKSWLSRCKWPRFGKSSKSCFLRFDGWNALFISPNGYCKNPGERNFSFWFVF